MHNRTELRHIVKLMIVALLALAAASSLAPRAQAQTGTPAISDPDTRTALAQLAPVQAAEATDEWTTYTDQQYGFTVQMPAGWHAYPADGSIGSVTTLSSADMLAATGEDASGIVQIQIGVVSYDRDLNAPLRDWVRLPMELSAVISVLADRPALYSDQLVLESNGTGEGPIRRAYVARGEKVYFVDLIPDDPAYDALYSYMLLSMAFTEPMVRPQPLATALYARGENLFLPYLQQSSRPLAGAAAEARTPENVPGSYRLPFVGTYLISQGPGCWTTHKGTDSEAIDFTLPSGTALYADETGTLTRYPDLAGYGNTVQIVHADGRTGWFSHLRQFDAPNGNITRDSYIGLSGGAKTDPGHGNSTGPHLHYMVLAAGTRSSEWIRTLPGITWFSGDSSHPCNDGTYGHPLAGGGFADGEATGPVLGSDQPSTCSAPSLSEPGDGAGFGSAQITLRWNGASCGSGYLLRIGSSSDIGSSSTLVMEAGMNTTQWTGELASRWYNRDLYWSVKATGVQNADWAPVRRFRINVSTTPANCPAPDLNTPAAGAVFQGGTITFGWSEPACTHNGFTFRIKTSPDMESGGTIVIDTGNGTTQRTQTVGSEWYNQDLYWSVKAANVTNAAWAAARRFRISPAATVERPSLSVPSNGVLLPSDAEVTLNWYGVANATQYKVELWGGAYGVMTLCNWDTAVSCRAGKLWPGTMSWHVKARSSAGQESDWSETWSFTVQSAAPTATFTATPAPPTDTPTPVPSAGQVTLSSPGSGAALASTTDVTLRWNTAANAAQYRVELWGGAYSLMVPCDWQPGASCHIGTMWPGTVSWHVKARTAGGQESAWSETWSFTIQNAPPTSTSTPTVTPTFTPTPIPQVAKPQLLTPGNGATMAQSTSVTLAWGAAANATQYKVELWGGPYSLMTPCNWGAVFSCAIGQMWPGTMYWHVKARDGAGRESVWSDTWSFVIQESTPTPTSTPPPTPTPTPVPSAGRPTLSNPGNGASLAQSTDVTLVWNSASNATQYKVELWGGPYSLMTPCDWQSGTSCHIGTMWPGSMLWHVKARTAGGQESDWSDTWTFTIQNSPPTPTPTPSWRPQLSSPGNGQQLARNTDVTLQWNSLSGATQYKVELWGGPYSLMTPCNWQSGTSCHIGTMWPGNMLWHVKARTAGGQESDWSEEWNFTILN